jgi:hypothetical protein
MGNYIEFIIGLNFHLTGESMAITNFPSVRIGRVVGSLSGLEHSG